LLLPALADIGTASKISGRESFKTMRHIYAGCSSGYTLFAVHPLLRRSFSFHQFAQDAVEAACALGAQPVKYIDAGLRARCLIARGMMHRFGFRSARNPPY
jgi:hypothetical protein